MSEETHDPTKPQPIGRGYTARVVVGIGKRRIDTEFGEVLIGAGAFVLEGPGGTHVCSRKFIEELLGPRELHRILTGEQLEPAVDEQKGPGKNKVDRLPKDPDPPLVQDPQKEPPKLPEGVTVPDVPELTEQQKEIQRKIDELKRQGLIA